MSSIYLKTTLVILFSAFSLSLSAQTIKAGHYKMDHHAYNVSKMAFGNTTQLLIREENKLNIQEAPDKLGNIYADYVQFTRKGAMDKAFIKVLGMNRIWLMPEESITLSMYVNTNGKILKIDYILNKNTKLKLKEINELTAYIKDHVSFKIPPDRKKESNPLLLPIRYTYPLKFKKLILRK